MFGVCVKLRIINSSRFHILHHAIFFVVMVTILIAAVASLWNGEKIGYALAVMAIFLLGMTRFRGRSPQHWQYATLCFSLYTVIFLYRNS